MKKLTLLIALILSFVSSQSYAWNLTTDCAGTSLPGWTAANGWSCFVPVQAVDVVTDGSGNFSGTWNTAFQSASPFLNAQPINPSASNPYVCNIKTSTSTTFTGTCWQVQAATLPSVALNLLSFVVTTYGTAPSIAVRIAGRDTTQ